MVSHCFWFLEWNLCLSIVLLWIANFTKLIFEAFGILSCFSRSYNSAIFTPARAPSLHRQMNALVLWPPVLRDSGGYMLCLGRLVVVGRFDKNVIFLRKDSPVVGNKKLLHAICTLQKLITHRRKVCADNMLQALKMTITISTL